MKSTLVQVTAGIVISLGTFFFSFTIAWPSYALEILESDASPIGYNISEDQGSLIGSLPMLGSITATPLSGWMGDIIGKKRTLILYGLIYVLGWSILATAKNVVSILISRFVLGLSNGANLVLCIPFISEISTESTKGPITSISLFVFTCGTLVSYVMGWLLTYQAINYFGLSLSIVNVVLLSFLKESPAYLIINKKEKEALSSLKFYRGVSKTTPEVLEEFNYLRKQINAKNSNTEDLKLISEKEKINQEESFDKEMSAWKILCTSKSTQRALAITVVNLTLLVFGGTVGIQAYAGYLFSIGAPGFSKHMCSIILSLAFVIGSLLSTIANGLLKRRTLQISSAVLSSILLAILASLLRWSWAPEWMVPVIVLLYSTCYQTGVASVTLVQMGEIFVPKVNNLVFVIATMFVTAGNFIVLSGFLFAVKTLGVDGTFLMFSMVCALTAVVAHFTMKETKGVPVEEIQRMYEQGYLYSPRR